MNRRVLISELAQIRDSSLPDRILSWLFENIENEDEINITFNRLHNRFICIEFKYAEDMNLFKLCFENDVIIQIPEDA